MLQQILKDMYIDPDVLEALNEEQKKILFLKMRQEQVRRWKEHEEKLEKEGSAALKPKPQKGHGKNVSWHLGRDGDVQVDVIREMDELRSSPLILPECSNLQNSTQDRGILRSSLVKHGTAEPVQSGTDNPSSSGQSGIQLHFKGVPLASETSQQAPASQDPEEDDDDDNDDDSEGTGEPPLSYRPHLRFAHTYSIADRLRRPRVSLEQAFGPLSVTEQLCPLDPQEKDKGKDFHKASMWQRAELEGPGPSAGDPVITRGRVAQLTKTFSVASSSGTTARTKPPVPNKPAHLMASSSVRHSLR